MKVTVVILNWNGKGFLQKFLPSVISCNASFSGIIVADNASTDDSIAFLKAEYPDVKVIVNAENGGFAKGYNDALQLVDAEYYVLLNSDVEVTPGWIDEVISLMDSDKNIAACQPKIKSFHNKSFFEYAGAAGGFIDKYGYPFCRGRIFESLEEDKGQYDDVREVFWATGACMFVRAECFHRVHGFDADFFAHMEEIDLCWRLKNLGYKVMYCPSSVVYHVGGGTLNKTSPQKTYLNFRNNLALITKNHPPQYFVVKLLWRMILDGVAGAKYLASGQFDHFKAILKAHFSFYGSFSSTMKKRRELKKEIVKHTTTAVYLRSILADYYFRKKRTFTELDHPENFMK
ncbi:MAG: glycosyl transferase family 2 [Segetibacter sp.]|nr:glycosyl transferase family 2 [Bacteroidota bacterium]MCW3111547.1 glycosyl transferase family 2 [Segetibacter sp.]